MYIRSVHIENIRSVEKFDMAFEEGHEAGWHVLIGENGSGKTTIARAVALGLIGPFDAKSLPFDWSTWVRKEIEICSVRLAILWELEEIESSTLPNLATSATVKVLSTKKGEFTLFPTLLEMKSGTITLLEPVESSYEGLQFYMEGKKYFAAGFGPFRRFEGGEKDITQLFHQQGIGISNYLSLFKEGYASTEPISLLKTLHIRGLEGGKDEEWILNQFITFLAESNLLPNGAKITHVSSEGVFFKDSQGNTVELGQLSDGFRSILSIAFEILVQMIRLYGAKRVFANIQKGEMNIPLPGVVIIDEVDAHLHPTWQTKIGQWFTKYFPQLQFIVTTHSPLICRACGEHGKIFKLAAPGSEKPSGEITGLNRDRLVYGDILEAYETDEFGDGVEWSDEGRKLQAEYRELVYKRRFGVKMTKKEEARLGHLKGIFHSHVEAD